jgi:molybdenum cofactor biosynthesis enzyme MoaA
MLNRKLIDEFDRFRGASYGTPVCPAPSINMHFSQMGVVTACCFNRTQVLGVYPRDSISQIWAGEPARELREALSGYDLTKGCEKCAQQIESRDFGGSHAVFYSQYARITSDVRESWGMHRDGDPERAPLPLRLEFNIHNSCNLQCVMCHGLASSSIRTHREGLPSMANPYDEAFVDQLEPFLPYVVEADFMGGEPMMIPVYRLLWARMAQKNPRLKACILTNATLLDDSIKAELENINCWMHISIDSHVRETYEKIRRGASYDTVMANSDYYRELMAQRGMSLMWRYCPMRLNWREIPDAVQHCNERDILLMYNQVDSPLSLSLHTLSPPELQTVVSYLNDRMPAEGTTEAERHNHDTYFELVNRLSGFLDPANRLNGLKARIDTSDAVIGEYSKYKKERVAKGVTLPVAEATSFLTEAAKRFVTTRLNVEQAMQTEVELPAEFADVVPQRFAEMRELCESTDAKTFVSVYLSELVRTYSGVWGVREVHSVEVFDSIETLATAVAGRSDADRVIEALLSAAPRDLYELLSSQSADAVLGFFAEG